MLKRNLLKLSKSLTVNKELSSERPSACVAASDVGFSALSPPAAKILWNNQSKKSIYVTIVI